MPRIALLIADGFEDSEFLYPYRHLLDAGFHIDIIAKEVRHYTGKHGEEAHADLAITGAKADDYDALFIPGGKAPEQLCMIPEMIAFVKECNAQKLILCAVCHGPLLLAEAGVLLGRTVTGYKSTEKRLVEAGALYTGSSVETDGRIITARDPRSLPEMTRHFISALQQRLPIK